MAEDEGKIAVINGIFKEANKHYVCPGCLKSYADFNLLKNHLKRQTDEIHAGLMSEEQSSFDHSYRRLVGREDRDGKFVLPSDRAAAFKIGFFVQHRVLKIPHPVVSRIRSLSEIAAASGMKFVCPQCVEKDFEYFNTMTDFRKHCRQKCDPTHTSLISTDDGTFFPSYLGAMKRNKVEDLKDPLSGRSRPGPPSFHEYLRIGYVFQEKV
jgi:transposase-like protein